MPTFTASRPRSSQTRLRHPLFLRGKRQLRCHGTRRPPLRPAHPHSNYSVPFYDPNPAIKNPAGRDRRLAGCHRRKGDRQPNPTPTSNAATQFKAANKKWSFLRPSSKSWAQLPSPPTAHRRSQPQRRPLLLPLRRPTPLTLTTLVPPPLWPR